MNKPEEAKTTKAYCSYCRKKTEHRIVSSETDGKGTGGDLRCIPCGSARLATIQGFNAELM